jgi:hypothetical protein
MTTEATAKMRTAPTTRRRRWKTWAVGAGRLAERTDETEVKRRGSMVVAMGFPFRSGVWWPVCLCDEHRSEQVFYSFTEQVFGVKALAEHSFSEQVFDLHDEHLYASTYV